VLAFCAQHQIPCTLLRPTLIYGSGRDRNISAIAGVIKRFGFFPIASPGTGLRQPVHADDLAAAGFSGRALSRTPPPATPALDPAFAWHRHDLSNSKDWQPEPGSWVIATVPLWLLPDALQQWPQVAGVVAFSSTSAATKADSADPAEQALAQRLHDSEQRVLAFCAQHQIPCTLLRPTLIYGSGRDRNISAIAGVIKRFGFFPIASPGTGLRQPVHADDLAAAAVACIDNPRAAGHTFELPGGETLSYRDMVARVFTALGKRPRIPTLPLPLLRTGLKLASRLLPGHYSPALFERMNQDLAFDLTPAAEALDYRPRDFSQPL